MADRPSTSSADSDERAPHPDPQPSSHPVQPRDSYTNPEPAIRYPTAPADQYLDITGSDGGQQLDQEQNSVIYNPDQASIDSSSHMNTGGNHSQHSSISLHHHDSTSSPRHQGVRHRGSHGGHHYARHTSESSYDMSYDDAHELMYEVVAKPENIIEAQKMVNNYMVSYQFIHIN